MHNIYFISQAIILKTEGRGQQVWSDWVDLAAKGRDLHRLLSLIKGR